ncbi:MAG: glycosyltransferase family 8 protein [Eubacteriales bacterium]|nr:glycosyltransferase family 8 protein [Eubacteriales bacterium]
MNVIYIATDSYVSLLGVSMLSLLENTSDLLQLNIYILSSDLCPQNQQTLSHLARQYKRTISYIDISGYEELFSFHFDTSGFHPIVLARLLLAEYLPDDLERILYLDCDTIVHGSLRNLEDVSLENAAFAAVPELCMPPAQKKALGLSPQDTYFNCGVLLIHLAYWRRHHLSRQFISYYEEMNGQLLYNDQDILNHCCRGHVCPLSHSYNLSPALRYFPRWFIKTYQPAYYCASAKEYRMILEHPSIIHFLGEERPWFRGNWNFYRQVYEHYKALSPWREEALIPGKELQLLCYHILNCITRICPWFRKWFTQLIGIRYYKLTKKK